VRREENFFEEGFEFFFPSSSASLFRRRSIAFRFVSTLAFSFDQTAVETQRGHHSGALQGRRTVIRARDEPDRGSSEKQKHLLLLSSFSSVPAQLFSDDSASVSAPFLKL
jgi:hypothetical protein